MIEIDDPAQDADGPLDALVPCLVAFSVERGVADIFVIGLFAVDRMMREFEMRQDPPVLEERRAGAGPERQHHFDPSTFDRAEPLHVGVVHDPHRLFPALGQCLLQVEAGPDFGAEMRCGQHPPVAHHARKPDRGAVELPKRRGSGIDRGRERLGRHRRHRGRHAEALADNAALIVEQSELHAGAADIDGQGARTCHGPLPLRVPTKDSAPRLSRPFRPAPAAGMPQFLL